MRSRPMCANTDSHVITITAPKLISPDSNPYVVAVVVPDPVSDVRTNAVTFDDADAAPELPAYTSSVVLPNAIADLTALAHTDEFADDH